MAIAFPQNPVDGDKYTVGGIVYEYSDGAWRLSSDNSKASIHVGTTAPNNPQQGDLWFHSGEADLKIYYIDSTSEQWIPASSPPDPYEENFVSISGDTMTGVLSFQRGSKNTDQFKISPNSAEDYNTNIYSLNDGTTRFRTSHTEYESDHVGSHIILDPNGGTPTTKIYKVATPTNPDMAASKQYVDDAVKNSSNRTWKWKTGGGKPGPGQWTSLAEDYIRIHHTTHNGMDLKYSSGFSESVDSGKVNIAKMGFTAWRIDGGKAQPKFFIWVGYFNDTSDYFELKDLSGTDKKDLGLNDGYEYELHLAGFF